MVCENIFTVPPWPNGLGWCFQSYVTIFKEILNIDGHPNRITGSKVTAILLKWWILPICGALAVKGLHLQPAQQPCFLSKIPFFLQNAD